MFRVRYYTKGRLIARTVVETVKAADWPEAAGCAVILRPGQIPLFVHRLIFPGEKLFTGGALEPSRCRETLRSHRAA